MKYFDPKTAAEPYLKRRPDFYNYAIALNCVPLTCNCILLPAIV